MDHKFSKNRKYYTISIYVISVVVFSAIFIKILYNWGATVATVKHILGMVSPFLMGFLIAYMINPLVKLISEKLLLKACKIKSHKRRNGISVLLSYIIVFSTITTIIVFVIPQIVDSFKAVTEFVNTAQQGYHSIISFIEGISEKHPQIDTTPVIEFIEKLPENISNIISKTIPTLAATIYSTSLSVITGVLNLLIAIMVSIYMLLDKTRLINNGKRFIYAVFKKESVNSVLNTARECNTIFSSFVVGKLIDSTIIGLLCFIALRFANIPCALVISVIVGITNMIPYFGPFIGAIPSILLLLVIDIGYALVFAIIILLLQQFDGLFLGPRILGDKTGLRPFWVIFAITIGGSLAGVAGMFLGVPTVAVIAHLVDKYMDKKINKKEVILYRNNDDGIIHRLEEGMVLPENCEIYVDSDTMTLDEKLKKNKKPRKLWTILREKLEKNKTDEKPENKTGEKSENQADDKPENKTDEKSDDLKADEKLENKI